jgi:hypothetical protein
MQDFLKPTGKVRVEVRGEDGVLKDEKLIDNIVTNAGRNWLWLMGTAATPPAHMGWMALGTGTTAAAITDVALQTETASTRTATTSIGTVASTQSQWACTFPPGVGTGAITEAGIFNASSAGTILAHVVFGSITKAAGDTLTITWTITLN